MTEDGSDRRKLVAVHLDPQTIERGLPDQEHERAVAVYDLVGQNRFAPAGAPDGPFVLHLGFVANRLVLDIRRDDGEPVMTHGLSLSPLRKVIKDYFLICESYYEAIRNATADKIEAIDMGRRGIHNEGARIVTERLDGKVDVDFETARRLFTLIAALTWKGTDR